MNLNIGRLAHGPRNLISDVPGVRVGHSTIDTDACHTGVTVILPPCGNPFVQKLTAASEVCLLQPAFPLSHLSFQHP